MRIKAKASLERLKAMKTKKRAFVSASEVDTDTWTPCEATSVNFVGRDFTETNKYIKLIAWANKKAKGKYSRINGVFWFENPRDAFNFKLKFGDAGAKDKIK